MKLEELKKRDIVLVTCAKDEDNYVHEWIDYHLKLGFDRVVIYQNNWDFKIEHPKVKTIPYNTDDNYKQRLAFNNFCTNTKEHYYWAAFFDGDEFLVLHKHQNVREFLDDYSDCTALGINWAMFGSSGLEKVVDDEYSVIKRFTKRSTKDFDPNKHIKTIMRSDYKGNMHLHNPSGHWYNTNKEQEKGASSKQVLWDVAQLNHYWIKSIEEMRQKIKRGRATGGKRSESEFRNVDKKSNVEDDFAAYNFFFDKN